MIDYGLVSIITPNWNCGRFIAQTIESVLAQTYQNWEMLIQDDCSSDDSMVVAKLYSEKDSRVKIENNITNSGAAVSRNNAIRRAKGRWIAFLDSDDLWSPNKLEKQLTFMVENGYHFSYTGRDQVDEGNNPIGIYTTGPKRINKFWMYCYCWVGCMSVIYNAEKVGLIQIADIKKNNDYAIWLQVIKKTDCYLLSENLATYRVRKGSISHTNYLRLIEWHYKMFRESDGKNPISAMILTLNNLFWGVIKKLKYEKRIDVNKK